MAPGVEAHDRDFGNWSRGKYLDSYAQEKTPVTCKLLIYKIKNLDLTCQLSCDFILWQKFPNIISIHYIANLVSREKRPVTKIHGPIYEIGTARASATNMVE